MSEIIDKLKKLDLESTTGKEISFLLNRIETFPLFIRTFNEGEIIVRTRPNNHKHIFDSKKDLIYPPNNTESFGRANIKGSMSFYGSIIGNDFYSYNNNDKDLIDAIVPTIVEQSFFKSSHKDSIHKITYGIWEVIQPFSVAVLVQNEKYIGKNYYIDNMILDYKEFLKSKDEEERLHAGIVTEYLSNEFSKEVPYGKDHLYRVSAYYTERVYNLGLFGLIYPSTKMEGSGINIVLKPEIVDNYLELKRAGECTIYRKNGIDVSLDRVTSVINSDGSFIFNKEGDGRGHIACIYRLGAKKYSELLNFEINKDNNAAIIVEKKLKRMFNIKGKITVDFLQKLLDTTKIEINIRNRRLINEC